MADGKAASAVSSGDLGDLVQRGYRFALSLTHEEARAELRKSYAYIRQLEDKKAEYKRERDRYKKRLKKYEDD